MRDMQAKARRKTVAGLSVCLLGRVKSKDDATANALSVHHVDVSGLNAITTGAG